MHKSFPFQKKFSSHSNTLITLNFSGNQIFLTSNSENTDLIVIYVGPNTDQGDKSFDMPLN